jgi:hypothetical protein
MEPSPPSRSDAFSARKGGRAAGRGLGRSESGSGPPSPSLSRCNSLPPIALLSPHRCFRCSRRGEPRRSADGECLRWFRPAASVCAPAGDDARDSPAGDFAEFASRVCAKFAGRWQAVAGDAASFLSEPRTAPFSSFHVSISMTLCRFHSSMPAGSTPACQQQSTPACHQRSTPAIQQQSTTAIQQQSTPAIHCSSHPARQQKVYRSLVRACRPAPEGRPWPPEGRHGADPCPRARTPGLVRQRGRRVTSESALAASDASRPRGPGEGQERGLAARGAGAVTGAARN